VVPAVHRNLPAIMQIANAAIRAANTQMIPCPPLFPEL
jgi:hypothetical protein